MCLRGPEPFALADKLGEMAPLIRSFLDHKVAKLKSMGFLHQSKAGSGSLHEGRSLTIVMHFVKWPDSTKRVLTRIPATFFSIVVGLAGFARSRRAASDVWGLTPLPVRCSTPPPGSIWLFLAITYGAKWLTAREDRKLS
ncbi:hypothetical protein GOD35_28570 [Sinorhizobium medicae]|nr:hypothetical protein [Sinorhizobium medicae]MDX0636126.1 hypothetical protein [Sinorhizobium medicae]